MSNISQSLMKINSTPPKNIPQKLEELQIAMAERWLKASLRFDVNDMENSTESIRIARQAFEEIGAIRERLVTSTAMKYVVKEMEVL
jgi:hypothetical protein